MWHRPQEEGFPEQSMDGIDSLADAAKTLHFFHQFGGTTTGTCHIGAIVILQ